MSDEQRTGEQVVSPLWRDESDTIVHIEDDLRKERAMIEFTENTVQGDELVEWHDEEIPQHGVQIGRLWRGYDDILLFFKSQEGAHTAFMALCEVEKVWTDEEGITPDIAIPELTDMQQAQEVRTLSSEQLGKELEAFFTFVAALGENYLSDEGKIRFKHLQVEGVLRINRACSQAMSNKFDGVDTPMADDE
jgi:hypothetical protein